MQNSLPLRSAFVFDLLLLALSFPLLYFPNYFPAWAVGCGFGALIGGWLWRRWRLGLWRVATPIDWPLFLLFFVMLPIAIWAAPETLRQQYSWPRAYILLWNFCLFWVVVTYSSLSWQLLRVCLAGFIAIGTAIAFVAPLGTNWLYKFTWLDPILQRIPSPLLGVFRGADSGFHPNQVSGTLLYVLPLMIALVVGGLYDRKLRNAHWWLLTIVTLLVSLIFALLQSRSGFLGLVVGLATMGLLPSKVGRRVLLLLILISVIAITFFSSSILSVISETSSIEMLSSNGSLGFRYAIWSASLQGIGDFPFTGMGFGTFRQIIRLLYPVVLGVDYDIAHAHNFFLQAALDFGIPGLISLLAIHFVAGLQLWNYWKYFTAPGRTKTQSLLTSRVTIIGLVGCFIATTVFGQMDAVTMGAKTNFMFWYLLGIMNCNSFSNYGKADDNLE